MIREKYTQINNYQVVGVREKETRKLTHFIICDRDGEKAINEKLEIASKAIEFINDKLENGNAVLK